MGICCSCISCNSAAGPDPATAPATDPATVPAATPAPDPDPATVPAATPAPELALDPFPDPDIVPTSPGNLTEGDVSSMANNVSGNSWFSIATTNVTTWMSQAKGTIRGKFVPEEVEFSAFQDKIVSELRVFTFKELKEATFNFRSDMLLGKGGFGSVYKGLLYQKLPIEGIRKLRIAVKKLDSNSKQGLRQWQAEGDKELLIVYEFMEKGSLNYHLFGKRSDRILPWETRVKIATGMAQALSYLHTMERPVIFRDFKTSNMLLNESYIPKLSDFGLAKWGPNDGSQCVPGNVLGTRGYVGPEYKTGGTLYVKSDVYSFGVVLVEMLTGLRAIDKNRSPEKQNLREWTLPILSDRTKLRHIMDPRLRGKYATKQAPEVAMLALRCLNPVPMFRPSMKEVADTLEGLNLHTSHQNEDI